MTPFEKELREAIALLDGVAIVGRESRGRMAVAEAKIIGVANSMKKLENEAKESKKDED